MADVQYSDARVSCSVCGRSFAPEVLAKHQGICKKSSAAASKRKVFDSSKQRVLEGELSLRQIKQAQKKDVSGPKNHWREKHEDLINSVRNARGVQRAMNSGGPLPPPPPPSINPDYIQCPYCSRRFNQQAGERHISFCKEQQARLPRAKPAGYNAASTKQNTRLNYQAPKLKPKTGPTTTPTQSAARGGGRGAPAGGARGRSTGAPAESYGQAGGSRQSHQQIGRGKHVTHNTNDLTAGHHSPSNHHPSHQQQRFQQLQYHGELDLPQSLSHRSNYRPDPSSSPYCDMEDNFFNKPDDFYTPYANSDSYRSSDAREDRTRRADGIPVKSKPSSMTESRYLSKVTAKEPFHEGPIGGNGIRQVKGSSPSSFASSFCYECGHKFPIPTAKFCSDCGVKRL